MRATIIALPLLVAVSLAIGCAQSLEHDMPEAPYHDICFTCQIIIDRDELQEVMSAHGIDYLYGLADLGSCPLMVKGSQETLFLARELVAKCVREQGTKVWWPADSIVLMNEWDQMGGDEGPWIRLASVQNRVASTETILGRLNHVGIPTYFLFGETSDVVFVKTKDSAAAIALLRESPDAGVTIHTTQLCIHHPPPFIRKGAPTVLTLTLAGSDNERSLRERVDDLTCWHQVPGEKITGGYTMQSKNLPDGTLVATYEVPPMPRDATGFFEYSFSFTLDGRPYWHRPTTEKFRVPRE